MSNHFDIDVAKYPVMADGPDGSLLKVSFPNIVHHLFTSMSKLLNTAEDCPDVTKAEEAHFSCLFGKVRSRNLVPFSC